MSELMAQPPACRQFQQLRDGLDVPVRLVDMHVPEVSGQLGDLPFDIEARSIPPEESADGKAMPHVVEPGAAAVAAVRRRRT
jgi:hypothetical protein